MIAVVQAAHPALSLRRLCALLGINRAWYDAQRREDLAARAAASRLRDAIGASSWRSPATAIAG